MITAYHLADALTSADLLPITAGSNSAGVDTADGDGADDRTTVETLEKDLVEPEE
jgi:hypothetical protein